MGDVSILRGLEQHLGTAKGFTICNVRIHRIQTMIENPVNTPDERDALTLELARLYSWQGKNLRAQVKRNRDNR
jgi:hypothetical protein